jgi:hypothetical protein
MLAPLKNAVTRLPYPAVLASYYGWWWLRDLRRAAAARRKLGLPLLSDVDLAQRKGSDLLFILGSGPSINAISAERWEVISRHDTLGFNFWLYHPFVPKFYFVESAPVARAEAACRAYAAIAERRAQDYAEALKVVTGLNEPGDHEVGIWPAEWRHGFHVAYDLPIAARTGEEFEYGLRFLLRRGGFQPSPWLQYLFKYASSVTMMIAFGVRMGYHNIVLCGIDLKSQAYFYQEPGLYPETASLELIPKAQPHDTTRPTPWRVPAKEVIQTMKRLVLEPLGIRLFVENRSSALWPEVPEIPDALLNGASRAATAAAAGD